MHNIKYIIVALFAASFANVMAQDDKSKSEFRVRVGYDFSVDKGGGGTFSLLPEIGWNLSDQFYLITGCRWIPDDRPVRFSAEQRQP